jgi:hypothetical protein
METLKPKSNNNEIMMLPSEPKITDSNSWWTGRRRIMTFASFNDAHDFWVKVFNATIPILSHDQMIDKVIELEAHLKEHEWISVKDKLPSKGEKVLCVQNPETTATRKALFAVFDGEKFYHPLPYYVKSDVKIGNWVDIIYWMPLPKVKK